MALFMLSHSHPADECATAYAAWRGFESPLRHRPVVASCPIEPSGRHRAWWTVDAASAADALAQLPDWVAERTDARRIGTIDVP